MKRTLLILVGLLLLLLAVFLLASPLRAQVPMPPPPPVGGIVASQRSGPLPGVTVSLVHPAVGRSSPSVSNAQGVYYFTNVPPQPQPYYIEAYWGNALIYRNLVAYQGQSVRFDIVVP